jgi:hypothetical protein
MTNETKQTAIDYYSKKIGKLMRYAITGSITGNQFSMLEIKLFQESKEMEKEQIGYTKADVIKAGEMGEINYLDTLHITTYLDEAKKFNETYGGNK